MCLRRFKQPTGRSRAPRDVAHRASAATHPVGFFNRPAGCVAAEICGVGRLNGSKA
jgi:hypothetical protein